MSDFVPRIFDGLTALTRELLDNATQQNWLQIENPDNGREPPEARPRTDRPSPHNTQPQTGGASKRPSASPSGSHNDKASVLTDRGGAGALRQTGNVAVSVQPYPVSASPVADALRETRKSEQPRNAQSPLNAPANRPTQPMEGYGKTAPVAAKTIALAPSNAREPLAKTQVPPAQNAAIDAAQPSGARLAGSDPTITRIERIMVSAGSQMASQELHAAVRPLSASEVSAFLDRSSALIATVFEKACADPSMAKTEDKQRAVRTALALAHLAAAIDKDPRSPSTMRLMQDISAVVLNSATANDNTVFTGLAQAIGVGAGIKLALMVAAALAHEEEDRRSRAPSLRTLMVAGFVRLGERIDGAHRSLLQSLGPLLMDWATWRTGPADAALLGLADFVGSQPVLLENLAPRLDRIEQVGVEAFRALRDLTSPSLDNELRRVQHRFIASDSVLGSIAGSRAALREINQMAAQRTPVENGLVELEAIKLVLTEIGFDAPRAAFLAERSRIDQGGMLGHNWTLLESFAHMEAQGRVFQQLLAFLNGQYIVEQIPTIIGFEDLNKETKLSEV
ncbi:hypothetical protein WH297_25380 [Ochrobactrum vermis]|uniref:Type III effector protein n=1 Tax=Ochrobactrum vermis TaxID=1827297 RepID=A0ABU8PLA6_9HYPH|nr:hypothetical protein [Ochrobactrum vermis]PQZ24415.1 hypothetical protein CQZ93_25730 [Ochrobactrum vermis]